MQNENEMDKVVGDGGPAYPSREYESRPFHLGMSLRDWFAGQASDPPRSWLENVCNTPEPYKVGGRELCEHIATWKGIAADAQLAERAKRGEGT